MRAKLVRESLNEEQDYGDNNPRIHRDSKYDWPDTGEETEIEVPDTSPAGEPYQMGADAIDPAWYEAFMEALHLEFPNEDEENIYMLLDIINNVDEDIELYTLFHQDKTPAEAAHIIANNEDAMDMWYRTSTFGQEDDDDEEAMNAEMSEADE